MGKTAALMLRNARFAQAIVMLITNALSASNVSNGMVSWLLPVAKLEVPLTAISVTIRHTHPTLMMLPLH